MVEHVDPLQPTSTFRFFVALVRAGFLVTHVCRELLGVQQTVSQSFPNILITRQRYVKHSYDGTVVNELHVLLCERLHLWSDSYQVGDIVSCCREARAGEHGQQWSVGSSLIGCE